MEPGADQQESERLEALRRVALVRHALFAGALLLVMATGGFLVAALSVMGADSCGPTDTALLCSARGQNLIVYAGILAGPGVGLIVYTSGLLRGRPSWLWGASGALLLGQGLWFVFASAAAP